MKGVAWFRGAGGNTRGCAPVCSRTGYPQK